MYGILMRLGRKKITYAPPPWEEYQVPQVQHERAPLSSSVMTLAKYICSGSAVLAAGAAVESVVGTESVSTNLVREAGGAAVISAVLAVGSRISQYFGH